MTTRGTKGPDSGAAVPMASASRSGARMPRTLIALLMTLAMALMLAASPLAPAVRIAHAEGTNVAAGQTASGSSGAASGASGASGGESTTPIAGPVPNVIITNFTYGEGSVAVGSDFTLSFTFQNKGKVAVSNMVVTVDGGENFAIAGGTNTFYFDALYAGRSATQSVPMQALPAAKSGAQGVTVSFRYEYVDSGSRSSSSSDIRISVPVSQPDRFQLDAPVPPEDATVGNETTITMNYVNKGKGDIANVEASIEGDGFDTTAKTQYIGNVASGANGSIGFAFTPTQSGELQAKLHIAYEDSDGKAQSKDFPVTVNVADAAPMPDDTAMAVDEQSQQGMPAWAWAAIAVAVIVVVVLIVVLVRRRRKKKAKKNEIDEEWDEWNKPDGDGKTGPSDHADGVPGSSATTAPTVPVPAPSAADPEATRLIATPQTPTSAAEGQSADQAQARRARRGRA
ncbi:ABC transporter permease [Bifidobacterium callitrichos]|uniref:ABC transporter permease n=2 Tax=Bifidobacterium callitrichos TaxID=762209 RepID=A0A2T3GB25_9BIFI|nr:ABC transporter permease [Bifidobacterium callitrichos]